MKKQIISESNRGPVPSAGIHELGTGPKVFKAFTLVELIVSIVILAILGTIAVISLQGYSKTSRDSVRISDLGNMKTSLELFHINSGRYPLTTDGYDVTYGGGNVWMQGVFGEDTFKNVDRLDKIPRDPLTDKEYTYSVLNTRQEYELAGIMEGDSFTLNNSPHLTSPKGRGIASLINKANAAEETVSVIVTGNYNGETLIVDKLGVDCIVAVPSIITSSGTTLETIIPNNYLVYNNYTNLPSNYSTVSRFKLLGETDLVLVNESNMDLYCGNFTTLETDETARLDFIDNLQKAYSGTQVEKTGIIGEVLNIAIDKVNPTPALKIYTIGLVEQMFTTTISDEQKALATACNPDYHFEGSDCILNTRTVIIANGEGTQTWNGTTRGSTVLSSCNIGFHTEDSVTCISNTGTCTIINGTGTNIWNGSSWDCSVTTCETDFYNPGNNTCTAVGNGYYSNSTEIMRTACTNKPTNSEYSGDGNGINACPYTCYTNYSGTSCVANTQTFTCAAKPTTGTLWNTVSSYTQTWSGTAWLPANTTTAYNATASTTSCRYKCATNYTWNGTSCVAVLSPVSGTGCSSCPYGYYNPLNVNYRSCNKGGYLHTSYYSSNIWYVDNAIFGALCGVLQITSEPTWDNIQWKLY